MVFGATICQIVARHQWPRQRIALTAVLCTIWAMATLHVIVRWREMYLAYVKHGQTGDSLVGYIQGVGVGNWSRSRCALDIVKYTTVVLNAALAELTNVWRCWELYHHNWLIVVFPLLGVICGLISYPFYLANTITVTSGQSAAPAAQLNWTIVYYSVTASINIITTSLILIRILSVGGLRLARTYRGLVEILVESACMYSTTYVIYLAVYLQKVHATHWSSSAWYVYAFMNAVTAAAPTMIIGRVMAGKARPSDSWMNPSRLPDISTTVHSIFQSIRFGSVRQNTTTTVDLPSHRDESEGTPSLWDEERSKMGSGFDVARHVGLEEQGVAEHVKREGVDIEMGRLNG
ncbi:hypothetical protein BDZ89DRAFT_1145379 [Hymenopellis radicata]|nr:hypothetical protein BDZ89DRAFT_1145379 [Hymenopellis radicata]